jgi:hypothetical protein
MVPLLIYLIANYIRGQVYTTQKSIVFLALIFSCRFLRSYFDMLAQVKQKQLGATIHSCVSLAIINKSFKYSTLCSKAYAVADISALVQLECDKLFLYPKRQSNLIWASYATILIIILVAYIGSWGALMGFLIMLIIMWIRIMMK